MFVNSRRNRRPFNLWPMKTASRERMKERKWIIYQCDAITIANAMILLLLLLLSSLLMLLFWFLLLLRLKCDKHRLSGTPTHIYRIVHTCYIWMRQFMCAVTFSAFFFLLGSPLLLSVLSIRGAERIKYLSRSAILHLHICVWVWVWTWETWYKSTSKLIVSKRLNSHEFMCVCVCVTFPSSYFPITAKQIVFQRNACVHSLTRTHMFNVWIFFIPIIVRN